MIPETGTPNDFKQAWFEAAATPMLGEVYAWIDGSQFRECWMVTEVKSELRKALIDVYDFDDGGRMHRRIVGSNVNLGDWARCIQSGAVRYVGTKIPGRVILW